MEEDNKRMCEMLTGLPVVACVGDDAASLGISTESLKALCSGGECT
jgi:dethiobiotin synthetase